MIFIAHCPNGTRAISKLIPLLCIFDESCHWLQFPVDYRVDDGVIFLLFRAKLFTEKLGSHKISNFISPWMWIQKIYVKLAFYPSLEKIVILNLQNLSRKIVLTYLGLSPSLLSSKNYLTSKRFLFKFLAFNFVMHQRSSSINSCLPSKVIFH